MPTDIKTVLVILAWVLIGATPAGLIMVTTNFAGPGGVLLLGVWFVACAVVGPIAHFALLSFLNDPDKGRTVGHLRIGLAVLLILLVTVSVAIGLGTFSFW